MRKIEILVIILLLISIWTNISNSSNIENINNNLNHLNQSFRNEINNVSDEVRNTLKEFKQESMWIRESNIIVEKYDSTLKNANMKIIFSLNEKKKNEKILLVATSDSERLIFELNDNDNLAYSTHLELPVDNYEITILGKTDDLYRSSRVGYGTLDLKRYISNAIFIEGVAWATEYNKKENKSIIDFDANIFVNKDDEFTDFQNELVVTEIKADIYAGIEHVDTIDLLNGKRYTQWVVKKSAFENMEEVKVLGKVLYEYDGGI